jgi:hypothetical protein
MARLFGLPRVMWAIAVMAWLAKLGAKRSCASRCLFPFR